MALTATIHTFDIELADADRHVSSPSFAAATISAPSKCFRKFRRIR